MSNSQAPENNPQIRNPFATAGADTIIKGQEHFISMDDGYEQRCLVFGNPQAQQRVFVFHGGPGAGISPNDLRIIQNSDLDSTCFVVLSQPYCHEYVGLDRFYHKAERPSSGKTRSKQERLSICFEQFPAIREMTFDKMIGYFDQVRQHFFSDKQISVWGGSAGGCLAMKYAIDYPQHVDRVLGRATSLFELCGSMNPDDEAATQRQWDVNPYFQGFVTKVREYCDEDFLLKDIMHKLYHGIHDLEGQHWNNDQKLEAAIAWRSWNLALAYSHGEDASAVEAQIQKMVRDQPEHALLFTAVFTAALEQEYVKFGPEYLKDGLKAIKMSHPHIRVDFAHGADDEICPARNAELGFEWHSGEVCDPQDGQNVWVSRDGKTRYFSATGGHFVKAGGGLDAAVTAILADWVGEDSQLRNLYPQLDGSSSNVAIIVTQDPRSAHRG